ncbi:SAM-dependent methyltransferase [Nibricoccus aquaticus]|uniref:SAM-dependent methyltransferase n=1 Tax=Nibricoccus aquaticus TaxID=2576891 RepID=A0A290QLN0_9BACT|nr:class I SAM-dependent methyltransferase [Nibricoccus aquaticus]ATC65381.1 SAM-dependent methyltransferase [Nibricoccus aquaticus]
MLLSCLQFLTSRCLSLIRRGLAWGREWADGAPERAAWIYPKDELSPEARYRDFNHRYFASLHEQERMLADRQRMNFYHAAISRHIKPGARVIDLGTGTGILAAFASRAGAAKVYAIDHSKILDHAKEIAAHNRLENVEFVAKHSKEFSLTEKVDVILHEQMGDCLFDEAMVANISDLRERLLKPGGLIVPSRFELFCEPIKVRDERLVPFIWEMTVKGYDYGCMERSRPQEPAYYRLVSTDLGIIDHYLGKPEPVLSFDLHTVNEAELPQEIRFSRTVVNAGRLDGYVVFFRAMVDEDLSLSSSPLDPQRAPHWGFRILRTDRDDFVVGDVIEVTLKVEKWPVLETWRWSHTKRAKAV